MGGVDALSHEVLLLVALLESRLRCAAMRSWLRVPVLLSGAQHDMATRAWRAARCFSLLIEPCGCNPICPKPTL
jgi:hypothetical protein